MKITAISDLHGFYPKLPGGDLLIVTGDLTATNLRDEYCFFMDWLEDQNYRKKIFISGNHDEYIYERNRYYLEDYESDDCVTYLCDSSTEFEYQEFYPCNFCGEKKKCQQTSICSAPMTKKLKIYGTPWTPTFKGMNPHCMAFTCESEAELKEKFDQIPDDIDILISHGPMAACLDRVKRGKCVGSTALRDAVERVKPKLLICGHIHEAYGMLRYKHIGKDTLCYNVSHVNELCLPVNAFVEIKI